jgi:hypothetical protein
MFVRKLASLDSILYRQQRKMKVVKRKAQISRGTFEYQRDGKTYQGAFTIENRYVNLSTQHGSPHAAQNIQTVEQIINMLLTSELASQLISTTFYDPR